AAVGTLINAFPLQDFFSGDEYTYDLIGNALVDSWRDGVQMAEVKDWVTSGGGWGMLYLVAGVYEVVGQNMLAVQLFNAVVGAATAPIIFLCARHIFRNVRVAKVAAVAVAFYPSLVLWSSQGLKDGPIVFLLAVSMLATLRLGERITAKYLAALVLAMAALITLRFYVFYMVAAAVVGAFVIGMRPLTSQSLTLPEMAAWWASFPLLVLGVWFTLRYRMRQALPILIFTSMLTMAYSIFQGNVGTAYRQRSQILVFYFIFVAVGALLLKEKR